MHGPPRFQPPTSSMLKGSISLSFAWARTTPGGGFALKRDKEAHVLSREGKHLHLENAYSLPSLIRFCLQMSGLYGRAQTNSRQLRVTENRFILPELPKGLEGLTLLQLSDLHVDMDDANLHAVMEMVRPLEYDLCVITGDYRRDTWGHQPGHGWNATPEKPPEGDGAGHSGQP